MNEETFRATGDPFVVEEKNLIIMMDAQNLVDNATEETATIFRVEATSRTRKLDGRLGENTYCGPFS